MDIPSTFSNIFTKGDNYHDILSVSLYNEPFQNGSTIKGKNLLLEEQILSFKS